MCRDESANNYSRFGRTDNSLCTYDIVITEPQIEPKIEGPIVPEEVTIEDLGPVIEEKIEGKNIETPVK